jgi:LysM repeat protein
MNTTPNPLIPQGTFLEQKGRSHIRIAVITILAVHVVLLGSLLMAGCKRTTDQASAEQTNEGGAYPPPPVTPLPAADAQPPAPATGNVVATPNPLTPVASVPQVPTNPIPPEPTPVLPPPVPTPVTTFSQGEHVVIKGESFYTIAKKYSVTSRAIQEANPGVDPARLKIGQKLIIPAKSASSTLAAPSNGGTVTNGGKSYTVKSGDTLNGIAKKHSVTVKDLQAANNLTTTQIKVGQKLRIPTNAAAIPAGVGNPGAIQ